MKKEELFLLIWNAGKRIEKWKNEQLTPKNKNEYKKR